MTHPTDRERLARRERTQQRKAELRADRARPRSPQARRFALFYNMVVVIVLVAATATELGQGTRSLVLWLVVGLPFTAVLLFWIGFILKRQVEGRFPA